jgi:alkyl hydroperoxide reductase subunit AhpF
MHVAPRRRTLWREKWQRLAAKALFVFIGVWPNTDWLRGRVAMDDQGFLLTGRDVPSKGAGRATYDHA